MEERFGLGLGKILGRTDPDLFFLTGIRIQDKKKKKKKITNPLISFLKLVTGLSVEEAASIF